MTYHALGQTGKIITTYDENLEPIQSDWLSSW